MHTDCATSLERYSRHIRSWPTSSTTRSVLPTVALVAAWSIFVLLGTSSYAPAILSNIFLQASISSGLVSTFSSPIALLLSLRANQAMNRLAEVRQAWGLMGRSIRSLAGLLATYGCIYGNENGVLQHEMWHEEEMSATKIEATNSMETMATSLLAARYLAIFGWCMKATFRKNEDENQIIRTALPQCEAEWLLSTTTSRPIAILARLRSLIQNLSSSSSRNNDLKTIFSPMIHLTLEQRLYDLEASVGVCNRILMSPIPPTYTRHTSRVLCLFLFLLPLTFAGMKMSAMALILSVITIAYVLVGIDEIGLEIAHPFPLLPMQGMALAFQKNVENQFFLMGSMPSTTIAV